MCANDDSGFCEWNGPPEKPPPDGQAHDDRHGRARAPALLRRDRDEVVPRAGDEVGELHLGDGAQAHDRGAGAAADDRGLGERRVDDAPRAELLLEAERDLEGAAVDADVLADQEDALVAPHLGAEPVGDRLQIGDLCHYLWWGVSRSSGVAYTPSSSVDGSGCGDSSARCERVVEQLLDAGGDLVLFLVGHLGVLAQPGAEALDRVATRPTSRTSPSGRRTRRRGRRGPPCAASGTRAASARRRRAPSRSRASPRGRRRARRCRRRRRPRSRTPAARSATCSVAYSRCDGVEYAHWLLSQTKTTGSLRVPAKVIDSCVSPRAEAPSPNQPTRDARLLADAEGERAADRDREHRRQVADHRDHPELRVGHVDVAVAAVRRAVLRGPCTARRSATARRRA